jgi:hypothetical protein
MAVMLCENGAHVSLIMNVRLAAHDAHINGSHRKDKKIVKRSIIGYFQDIHLQFEFCSRRRRKKIDSFSLSWISLAVLFQEEK